MNLSALDWHRLANGWFTSPIRILTLDPVISVRLGVSTTSVWIRPEYIQKIRFKHRIEPHFFAYLASVALHGAAFIDADDSCRVQAFGDIEGRCYRLVLKGIPRTNEIWLQTFHSIGKKQMLRRTKKMVRIK